MYYFCQNIYYFFHETSIKWQESQYNEYAFSS